MEAQTAMKSSPRPLLPRLPVEVFDLILDNFDAGWDWDDYHSVSNFSIASSSWVLVNMCRKHLFSHIDIHTGHQAQRLAEVLDTHTHLGAYVKSFNFYPSTRRNPEDHLLADLDEDCSEDAPTSFGWEEGKNPCEHEAVRRLVLHFTRLEYLDVRTEFIRGGGRFYDATYWEKKDEWLKLMSLPTLISFVANDICVPISFLGAPPNLRHLYLSRDYCPFEDLEELDLEEWRGKLQTLESISILQSNWDMAPSSDFFTVFFEGCKSTTLTTVTLDVNGPYQKFGPWKNAFTTILDFGSESIKHLEFSFPNGVVSPFSSLIMGWVQNKTELSSYIAKLENLETIHFNYIYPYFTGREETPQGIRLLTEEEADENLADHTRILFEPFMSTIMEGLVIRQSDPTKTPLKEVSIDLGFTGCTILKVNPDVVKISNALQASPAWGKLDSWLAEDLATARGGRPPYLSLAIYFETQQVNVTPKEVEEQAREMAEIPLGDPLMRQMARLEKAGAVSLEIGESVVATSEVVSGWSRNFY
ncbi:hypothetical protein CC1G_14475 [Coprinopsis cinerea okayama7|uniref:Uncharacterized protein n=1 Tax=Coprinopsis cinerea (strain Okayama-7 / 130 / ATCC MYA-4618 / FGSC 9003) TaxID=240176 RepID=D6RMD0_COPC7|nr:hypothetical protein CC1G_14475 [Coprinopsis cinerea okayama7\|eukprot:XP_002911477.1 hypothetical protein CC1G_14475 [Coprinopsis cinerea okayama7\